MSDDIVTLRNRVLDEIKLGNVREDVVESWLCDEFEAYSKQMKIDNEIEYLKKRTDLQNYFDKLNGKD